MSDAEYHDSMESLQFSGAKVKWYVHRPYRFSKREGYSSRAIARQIAMGRNCHVTPVMEP